MADYYPLLARAIANLATNEIDIRQSIYARARDALDRQLKSLDPALSDADILKEKLALEDVVRRVEQEQLAPPPHEQAPTQSLADTEVVPPLAPPQDRVEALTPAQPAASSSVTPLPISLPKTDRPKILPRQADAVMSEAANAQANIRQESANARQEYPSVKQEPDRQKATEIPVSTGRIVMPDESSARRRTGKLGVLAAGGVAAMIAMGALALSTREGPERYTTAQRGEPATPILVDQSKQEGRLASVEAPDPTPRQIPRETPSPEPAPSLPAASSNSTAPSPPVTPLPILGRAFMILEVPGAPPNQYEGQANWSFMQDPAGKPGEKFVRLQAEFVAAGLSVDFALSRNMDTTLNASHTIFMSFEPRPGMPPVKEMSAIEWRERETQSGAPLIGVLVPVQDNAFMIGLDKSDAARARNLDLLQTQKWMVFEVRMGNARRGAFLIEKGSAGDKVISDALAAWK